MSELLAIDPALIVGRSHGELAFGDRRSLKRRFITFQEIKRPGTKIICAIVFSIGMKEGAEPAFLEAEFRTQPELPLENAALEEAQDEEAKIVDYIKKAYLVSGRATIRLGSHCR